MQVGLPLLTLLALLCLLAAVQEGLLGTPDMAVAGNEFDAHALRWFADRGDYGDRAEYPEQHRLCRRGVSCGVGGERGEDLDRHVASSVIGLMLPR